MKQQRCQTLLYTSMVKSSNASMPSIVQTLFYHLYKVISTSSFFPYFKQNSFQFVHLQKLSKTEMRNNLNKTKQQYQSENQRGKLQQIKSQACFNMNDELCSSSLTSE